MQEDKIKELSELATDINIQFLQNPTFVRIVNDIDNELYAVIVGDDDEQSEKARAEYKALRRILNKMTSRVNALQNYINQQKHYETLSQLEL